MAASCGIVFLRRVGKVSANRCQIPVYLALSNREMVVNSPVRWSSSEPKEPPIPEWQKPANEPIERTKARLLYQSRKRGITENGLILGNFAGRFLDTFNETQIAQYDALINKPNNDWDLFNWATGNKPTPPEYDNEIMTLLKEFVSNPTMESRLRQPDLPKK